MSGMSADNVYHPKLWYYDQLMFLTDQETPMETTSSLASNSDHEDSDVDDVANTPGNTSATTNTSDSQSVRSHTPIFLRFIIISNWPRTVQAQKEARRPRVGKYWRQNFRH